MKSIKTLSTAGLLISLVSANSIYINPVIAADHQEAPGTAAQVNADIGDYYAWHEGELMNLVLTFGTFAAPGSAGAYDPNLLYSFHFDTSNPADGLSDLDLHARFAQDDNGNWGLQVIGASDAPIAGPVETTTTSGDIAIWAGLADDPFFFDLTGFQDTLSTGVLSFNPERDDVAGLNVTAIAIQLPINSILSGGGTLQTWATTNSL
jgi:hypothetical protein